MNLHIIDNVQQHITDIMFGNCHLDNSVLDFIYTPQYFLKLILQFAINQIVYFICLS